MGFWKYAGVSRTLNVTYLKGVPVGEVCTIECEVVSIGKRLGMLSPTANEDEMRSGTREDGEEETRDDGEETRKDRNRG